MEDSSQESKQNYLRENILDKGYDATTFINFLKSKKGEKGEDISNWSMPDLQEVVQEFISKMNIPQNQIIEQNHPGEANQIKPLITQQNPQINQINLISPENNQQISQTNPDINQQIPQINQINPQNNQTNLQENQNQNNENLGAFKEEDFGIIIPDFIECRKSEITELSKYKNIEIKVSDPKKVDKGFFSKAYIDFEIKTNPCNFIVRRQHAEFVWLRERLSVIFNTNILPRLPKKGKVNGDPHLQKRMRNLEKFLYYLTKDPLIKSSQILLDFLSIDKEEEYNTKKKIYNKMRSPNEFNDIKSIDGKARLKITDKKEKNIEDIKNNASFNETSFKKLNQNFKIFKEEMNTVISRVLSFSPLFDKLIKTSNNFLEDNIIIESYKQMKNLFNSWADILKKQSSFFCNGIKEYLKIMGGNYHHLRELAQFVETQKYNYYKISKGLISKKMELYRKGDTSNWQLDINDRNKIGEFSKDRLSSYKKICYKDTVNAIKSKEKYGYYLNRLISEYVRMRNINAYENKDKVKQFSKKQGQIMSEYFKKMGEIILIIDGCMINDAGENFIETSSDQIKDDNNRGNNNINQQQEPINEENVKEENTNDNDNRILEKEENNNI